MATALSSPASSPTRSARQIPEKRLKVRGGSEDSPDHQSLPGHLFPTPGAPTPGGRPGDVVFGAAVPPLGHAPLGAESRGAVLGLLLGASGSLRRKACGSPGPGLERLWRAVAARRAGGLGAPPAGARDPPLPRPSGARNPGLAPPPAQTARPTRT